ncbi:Gfo/Idh/MocA family protein [Staphylospora marina]|uniref:Gfo/Idh/MocA family protein n=1 Tax=Staphylospora marina TaxID=2490858 RepID=UPI000F5BCBD8|nr:Gfo/Idh/MocA family oxidoreductase [Staphylospora marina]
MQKVRIGIVGAGGISRAHLSAIAKEPRTVCQAIADVSLDAARNVAEEYRIPEVHADYVRLLESPDIDAVIVCVPNFLHSRVTVDALRAGKHVLTEKPMALNVHLAREMKEAADQAGKVLMVAQNNRFRPETQLVKRWVESGRLGNIYHVKTGWIRRNGIPGWGSWFTQKQLAGGGPLIDVGVHVLDLALWVIGHPKPVSVVGKTYDVFGPRRMKLSGWGQVQENGIYDVEDLALAMIQFEQGISMLLEASWASYINEDRVYLELYGDKAGASVDFNRGTVTLFEDNGDGPVDTVYRPGPGDDRLLLLTNFTDAILSQADPVCKPEEGILIQEILDAAYLSAKTGDQVRFAVPV